LIEAEIFVSAEDCDLSFKHHCLWRPDNLWL